MQYIQILIKFNKLIPTILNYVMIISYIQNISYNI